MIYEYGSINLSESCSAEGTVQIYQIYTAGQKRETLLLSISMLNIDQFL